MLKIWGRCNSVNVKKILWLAEEAGLEYENIQVGGPYGGLDTPEYRALNPNGLIPVIEDDGFVLWESNTILRYLANKYQLTALYPADPEARADIEQWMDWTLTFFAPFRDVFYQLIRTAPEKRDQNVVDAAYERCVAMLKTLNQALEQHPYLGGNQFSIADIAFGGFAYIWFELPIEHPVLPGLECWYQEIKQRPLFQKIVQLPVS